MNTSAIAIDVGGRSRREVNPERSDAGDRNSSPIVVPPDVLLLGALLIANCACSVLWPSTFTAMAAMALWLFAIVRMFTANPRMVVMLLPFIILHLSIIVSMNAIEAGAYMQEMGSTGTPSTASASYVLYSLLFLLCGGYVYRARSERAHNYQTIFQGEQRPFPLRWGAVIICAAIVGYLSVAGMRNGFPLLTGTDRFQYRINNADILTLNFLNLKFVIGAFLGSGAVFAATNSERLCHHLTFLSYVVVSFLFGDKFFIILIAAGFYSMPFMIRRPGDVTRTVLRIAPFGLLAVACVFAVTLFIYSDYGRLSLNYTLTKLGDRIAGQGQLWFLAVRDASRVLRLDLAMVRENLASLFANPGSTFVFEHRLAPFYFVEKYTPSTLYLSFVHHSGAVTPTMVFEAYGLVAFGYLGLAAAMIAAGALVGVLLAWLARATMSGNPFDVLLPAYVMTQAQSLMSQATLYSLLGRGSWKAYAAFLFMQMAIARLMTMRLIESRPS